MYRLFVITDTDRFSAHSEPSHDLPHPVTLRRIQLLSGLGMAGQRDGKLKSGILVELHGC